MGMATDFVGLLFSLIALRVLMEICAGVCIFAARGLPGSAFCIAPRSDLVQRVCVSRWRGDEAGIGGRDVRRVWLQCVVLPHARAASAAPRRCIYSRDNEREIGGVGGREM